MRQGFTVDQHFLDPNGAPEGGQTCGVGFAIAWQRGPLGRGDQRVPPNGAFVEDVIAAAVSRIEFYQGGRFACAENGQALNHLKEALYYLDRRTNAREAQGVEGTHGLHATAASPISGASDGPGKKKADKAAEEEEHLAERLALVEGRVTALEEQLNVPDADLEVEVGEDLAPRVAALEQRLTELTTRRRPDTADHQAPADPQAP